MIKCKLYINMQCYTKILNLIICTLKKIIRIYNKVVQKETYS